MDRSASSGFLAELAKNRNQPFHLIEIQFDSATTYATDAARDIVYNGQTYLALSHFLEFSAVEETSELKVSQCTVSLSGVDQTMIAVVLDEPCIDRRLLIYKGFLAESEPYLDLPAVAANYGSTPDSAANSITGDIDFRWRVGANDWTPAATQMFCAKFGVAGMRSFQFFMTSAGLLRLLTSSDGTGNDSSQASSAAVGFTDGTLHWVRVTRVAATGVLQYFTSENYDPDLRTGTWTQLGTDRTSTPGNIFNSGQPVEVGTTTNGSANALAGNVYRGQIFNGINGALAVDFNPADGGPGSPTSWVSAATREAWTVNQSGADPAKVVAGGVHSVVASPVLIFDGRMDQPQIVEDPESGKCVVTVEAASHWVDWERRPGRHTNHEEHQIEYPGDDFFEYVSELNRPIVWGRETAESRAKYGPRFPDSGPNTPDTGWNDPGPLPPFNSSSNSD